MAEAKLHWLSHKTSSWLQAKAHRRRPFPPLPPAQLARFAKEHVEFAARAWPMKAAEELRSAAIFSELQRLSILCDLPIDVSMVLASAAQDELLHAELCLQVAGRLGAAGGVADLDTVWQRFASHPEGRERFLALLLVEVAIGETISCALFRAAARNSGEPLTRAAFSLILHDEAVHSRIGWEVLAAIRPELSTDECLLLSEELRQQFALLEQSAAVPSLLRLESGTSFPSALTELGILSPESRVNAFYDSLEKRILPKLDSLALWGTAAWEHRYKPQVLP